MWSVNTSSFLVGRSLARRIATAAILASLLGSLAASCGDDSVVDAAESDASESETRSSESETRDSEPTTDRFVEAEGWPPIGNPTDVYADGLVTAPDCAAYGATGPYDVGVLSIEIDGVVAEVWYPAAEGVDRSTGRDFYDLREWLPEDERGKLSDEVVPVFVTGAWRDVPAADDSFPLVLFSHGLAGYRYQSSVLTVHLASWGMVVASIDHPQRTLDAVLGGGFGGPGGGDETVLVELRDTVRALSSNSGHPLEGRIRSDFTAVSGHSAGAGETATAVDAGGFDAAIYYAGNGSGQSEGIVSLAMAGSRDRVINPSASTRAYERLSAPRQLAIIKDAGHLAFSDICLVGRDEGGLLAVASENGVNVPTVIRTLANDGCRDNDLPAELSWPIIHHVSTSFLLWAAGADGVEPVSSEDLSACFGDDIDESRLELELAEPSGEEE